MIKRLVLILLALTLAAPAQADFREIARSLDARLGTRTWLPFLGLGRFLVQTVRPKGVHDFQLALFDGPRRSVDPLELEKLVQGGVEKGFAPLVRVRSNRSDESVFVWARPHRRSVELIVLVHERSETVLVRVVADAETVAREFGDGRGVVRLARR